MKTRNILITMAALAVAAGAFALPGDPPPPPPPELNDCSPGFWKNHQEWWAGAGQFCGADACDTFMLGELKARGPGSGDRRQNAVDALNSWADGYYGALICTD